LDDVFRALADASRRQLLDRLNEQDGLTLRELCNGLDMARQSVSKHLAILEDAHLVTTTKVGREKHHHLNPVPINAIADRWMTRYDRARAGALADLAHALERPTMDRVTYTTYIKASPERVWEAITAPAFTTRYWGVALRSDWQVGAHVTWEYAGVTMDDAEQVVLEADPPRRLSYRWHAITPEFAAAVDDGSGLLQRAAEEQRSKVTWELEPVGELVRLTVTHDDFPPGSVLLDGVQEGWPSILASLKTLLETGEPLPFPEPGAEGPAR
jgi:uncharacterized protein YndB with AHSA1/START domain/DNA-binding transcriptional ArsR family regulator